MKLQKNGFWRDPAKVLAHEIKLARPRAGNGGILVEKTGRGIRLATRADYVPATEIYAGLFKTAIALQNGVKMLFIYNARPDLGPIVQQSAPAGYAVINDKVVPVPSEFLTLPDEYPVHVIARFGIGYTGIPTFNGYEFASELESATDGSIFFLIASLCKIDGRVTVVQQQHGMIYGWIFRECYEVNG